MMTQEKFQHGSDLTCSHPSRASLASVNVSNGHGSDSTTKFVSNRNASVVCVKWQVSHHVQDHPNPSDHSTESIHRSLASLIARQIASDLKCLPGGSPEDRETGEGLTDGASVTNTSRIATATATGGAKRRGLSTRSPSQPCEAAYPEMGGE
jgi:hypothetical protein